MDLKEYLRDFLPEKCGVHKSFGEVAWLVFCEEQNGNPAFSADSFKCARERAKLGMPYKPKYVKEYKKGLDVLEMLILVHRQKHHFENNDSEIEALQIKRRYDEEEISVLASDIWNG